MATVSKISEKVLGRAILIEKRKEDGAQKYELADGNVEWITGWPRASNVEVGDTGKLVYRTTPSYGLVFFVKDKVEALGGKWQW